MNINESNIDHYGMVMIIFQRLPNLEDINNSFAITHLSKNDLLFISKLHYLVILRCLILNSVKEGAPLRHETLNGATSIDAVS